MTIATPPKDDVRLELRLKNGPRVEEDLAEFGRTVGPRVGANKRSQAEKEDFCMRRLLTALHAAGELTFPLTLRAAARAAPDFTLAWDDGSSLGIEVTEAGEASWQAWLTQTEGTTRLLPASDGYVGDWIERTALNAIINSIRKKADVYRRKTGWDLLVYVNSEGGFMADKDEVVRRLSASHNGLANALHSFRYVHILFGDQVYLNVFEGKGTKVGLSEQYSDDWVGWVSAQAERLKNRDADSLDYENLAEELEALARKDRWALSGQLRRILIHLLKWCYQPSKRSDSWRRSIDEGRSAIEELIEESPSLESAVEPRIVRAYSRARREAARQTKLPLSAFPEACPWTVDQVMDEDYLPEKQG